MFLRLIDQATGQPIRRRSPRVFRGSVVESSVVDGTSFGSQPPDLVWSVAEADLKKLRFVSVAVEPTVVLRSLRLAGGGDASHAGDQVFIQPQVLAFDANANGGGWRDVPVLVRVRLAGHEPLEFRFTARDIPLAARRLTPSK